MLNKDLYVMIYIYERNEADSLMIERAEELLSKERWEKFKKYKFQREKELCFTSFQLLRYGLAKEYGMYSIPEICVGEYGKPYLRDTSVFFNISHCDNSVLCSISRSETGADIQDYREDMQSISSKILSEGESHVIARRKLIENQELVRFWTLKEAYGKYYGFGLGYNFASMDFSSVKSDDEPQSYDGLTVFSKCFERYAVSVFSDEPLKFGVVSASELYAAFMK